MKHLICLLLIAALAIILPFSFAEEATVQVGDIITLGTYEQDGNSNNGNEPIHWQVLAVEDDKALVISEIGLAAMSYGTPMDVASYTGDGLYWETSYVRNWLNDYFLAEAFSDEERESILVSQVTTNDAYGNCITEDNLFCLSIDEADQYFDSAEAMACGVSEVAKKGLHVDDGAITNGYGNWLLRDMTSVVKPQQGSNFMSATYNESAYISGTYGTKHAKEGKGIPVFCDYLYVVRPAMWIEIASINTAETAESETIEDAEQEYVTLQKGSRGDEVKALQERLNELGYDVGTADGIFGGKTENSLYKFKEINALIYPELKNSENGIANNDIQELLFSNRAIYNLENLKGYTIIDEIDYFKGDNFKRLNTDVSESYSYQNNTFLEYLKKYDENDYSQLKIENWHLEITSVAEKTIAVRVYDETNNIYCKIYSDGKAGTTCNIYAWLLDIFESIPTLEKAATEHGYNFFATIEGFNFSEDYVNEDGVVNLLDADIRERIISEYDSAYALLYVSAVLAEALG